MGSALGVRATATAGPAFCQARRVAQERHRSVYPRSPRARRPGAACRGPRETLIRRVSLDLTGLPPTPAEVDAFLADTAPDAYERLVDRLLASPALWRADGLGLARRRPLRRHQRLPGRPAIARCGPGATGSIEALNRNMPFDQFTIEQLAGDLLPGATPRAEARHGVLPQPHDQRRRGPDRRGEPRRLRHGHGRDHRHGLARPDLQLLPLPRPQVRPDHASATTTASSPSSTRRRSTAAAAVPRPRPCSTCATPEEIASQERGGGAA